MPGKKRRRRRARSEVGMRPFANQVKALLKSQGALPRFSQDLTVIEDLARLAWHVRCWIGPCVSWWNLPRSRTTARSRIGWRRWRPTSRRCTGFAAPCADRYGGSSRSKEARGATATHSYRSGVDREGPPRTIRGRIVPDGAAAPRRELC